MRFNSLRKLALAAMVLTGAASAQAQAETVTVAQCAITGPGVLVCGATALVLHEVLQLGNGKKPFGDGGEGMKVINGTGDVIAGIFGWGGNRGGTVPPGERMTSHAARSDRLAK